MSDFQLGIRATQQSMEGIAQSVAAVTGGFEQASRVIGGLYDDLILWERASEYWQNKSFKVRSDEIRHLSKLGRISAQEEAELWSRLFDERLYGWRNVKTAEENHHQAMYQHSKQWIEEQTALGKLSAQEVAQAWQKVFAQFDDGSIKYQAALQIRSALLGEADTQAGLRRNDSDRWMRRQDLYDGGDPVRRAEDYTRRIEAERALLKEIESGFLNGVELGAAEMTERWREVYEYIEDLEDKRFAAVREHIRAQAEEYAKAQRDAENERYDLQLDAYNRQLSALSDQYEAERRSISRSEQNAELSRLLQLRGYYENAATSQGKAKYDDLTRQINRIYNQQWQEDLQQEYTEKQERVQRSIDRLKIDHQDALSRIEQDVQTVSQRMSGLSLSGIAAAERSALGISEILTGVNQAFAAGVLDLFARTEQSISAQVSRIARAFETLNATPANSPDTSVSVTLNDYGSKSFNSAQAIAGYAGEFLNIIKNALRAGGVR